MTNKKPAKTGNSASPQTNRPQKSRAQSGRAQNSRTQNNRAQSSRTQKSNAAASGSSLMPLLLVVILIRFRVQPNIALLSYYFVRKERFGTEQIGVMVFQLLIKQRFLMLIIPYRITLKLVPVWSIQV